MHEVPLDIHENQRDEIRLSEVASCLGAESSGRPGQGRDVVMHPAPEPIGFDSNASGAFNIRDDGLATTIKVSGVGGDATDTGATRTIVRRLTPLECERLMGWDDDWTAWGIDDNGDRIEIAATNRYRICGNGIVANVTEWIGGRLP